MKKERLFQKVISYQKDTATSEVKIYSVAEDKCDGVVRVFINIVRGLQDNLTTERDCDWKTFESSWMFDRENTTDPLGRTAEFYKEEAVKFSGEDIDIRDLKLCFTVEG